MSPADEMRWDAMEMRVTNARRETRYVATRDSRPHGRANSSNVQMDRTTQTNKTSVRLTRERYFFCICISVLLENMLLVSREREQLADEWVWEWAREVQ